jgi:nucleotide-binding universal stress UspA family protein
MSERSSIAVGVDGTWADNGAVDWAAREAELTGAPIRVLHVIDSRPSAVRPFDRTAGQVGRELVDDVGAYLTREDDGERNTGVLLSGAPAHTLAGCTANDRMLVVGRHGRGLLGRLLIGSTAEAVAHQAGTAVVVVPAKWTPGDESKPVVVGIDELDRCEDAVAFAAGLAAERGAPIRLVHVWDVGDIYPVDPSAVASSVAIAHHYHHDRMATTWRRCRERHAGVRFETELRRGHPVSGLIDAAQEADAQMLVIGGRSHSRMIAALLGATARGILQHATCPIAIVHQHRLSTQSPTV